MFTNLIKYALSVLHHFRFAKMPVDRVFCISHMEVCQNRYQEGVCRDVLAAGIIYVH